MSTNPPSTPESTPKKPNMIKRLVRSASTKILRRKTSANSVPPLDLSPSPSPGRSAHSLAPSEPATAPAASDSFPRPQRQRARTTSVLSFRIRRARSPDSARSTRTSESLSASVTAVGSTEGPDSSYFALKAAPDMDAPVGSPKMVPPALAISSPPAEAEVPDPFVSEPETIEAAPEPQAVEAAPEPQAVEAVPEPQAIQAAPEPKAEVPVLAVKTMLAPAPLPGPLALSPIPESAGPLSAYPQTPAPRAPTPLSDRSSSDEEEYGEVSPPPLVRIAHALTFLSQIPALVLPTMFLPIPNVSGFVSALLRGPPSCIRQWCSPFFTLNWWLRPLVPIL
jgi:hypothetical protein